MIYLTYLKTSHFNLKPHNVESVLNSDNEGVFLLRNSCTSDILMYTNKTCKENYLEQEVSCCSTNVRSLCTREKQIQLNMQSTQSTQNKGEDEVQDEGIPRAGNKLTTGLHNRDRHCGKYKHESNSCRAQLLKGTLNKNISKIKGKKKITKQENRSKRKHQYLSIKNSFKGNIIVNKEKCEQLLRSNYWKKATGGFIKERKIRKNVHSFEKKNFLNTVENFLASKNTTVHLKKACEHFFKSFKQNIQSTTAQKCLRRISKGRAPKEGNCSVDILDITEKYARGNSLYAMCIEYNPSCRKRDEGRRLAVLIKKQVVNMKYFACTERKGNANVLGQKGSITSGNAQSSASFHKRNKTNDVRRRRPNKEPFIVVLQVIMDVNNVDMNYHDKCMKACQEIPLSCVLSVESCPLNYNVATMNCNIKLRGIPDVNQKKHKNKIQNKNIINRRKNKNNKEKSKIITNVVHFLNHLSSTVPHIRTNRCFISLAGSTILCKTYNVQGSIIELLICTKKKYHGTCRIVIARIISIPHCMQGDTHQCIRNNIYYELYQAVYLARHCDVIFHNAIMSSFYNITHQQSFLCVQNYLENCIIGMGYSFFQNSKSAFAIFRAVSNSISISTTVRNKLPFPKPLFFRKYKIFVTQYQNIINYAIFFLDLCEHIITYHYKKKKILLRTKEKISLLLYYFGDRHGVVKYQRKHFFHRICSKRCSKQEKYCEKDFVSWLSDLKLEDIKYEVQTYLSAYLQHFKNKKGQTEKSHECVHQNEVCPHHQNSPCSSSNYHSTLYYAMKKLILYFCHYFAAPYDTKTKYANICKRRHTLKKPSAGASECRKHFLHIHVMHTLTGFLKRDVVELAYARMGQASSFHGPSHRNASSVCSSSNRSSCGSTHEGSHKNRIHIGIRLRARQHKNHVIYNPNCTIKCEETAKRACTSDHTQRYKSNNFNTRMLDQPQDIHSQYLKVQLKRKLALHIMLRRGSQQKRCGSNNDKPTIHTHKPNDSRRNIHERNPISSDHYYIGKVCLTKIHNNVVRTTDQIENKMHYTWSYTHTNVKDCINNRHVGNDSNTLIIIIRDQLKRSIERLRYHIIFCTTCQNILHHNVNHMSYCHNRPQIRLHRNPNCFIHRAVYMHVCGNYGFENGCNRHCRSNCDSYFHSSIPHRGYHQNCYHHSDYDKNGYCYNFFLHNNTSHNKSCHRCYSLYLKGLDLSSNHFIGRNNDVPKYGNIIFVKREELHQKEKKDISYYFNVFFNNKSNNNFSRTVDRNKEINCTHTYTQPHQKNGQPNYYIIPNDVYTINNNNVNKQNILCTMCKSRSVRKNEHYYHTNSIGNSFEGISNMKKDPNIHNTHGGHSSNNYLNASFFDEQCLSNNALNDEMGKGMLPSNSNRDLPNANSHVLNKSRALNDYRKCNNVNQVTNIFCMCGIRVDASENEESHNQGCCIEGCDKDNGDNEGGNNRSSNEEGTDNQGDKESNEGCKKRGADNKNNNKNNNNGRSGRTNGDNSNHDNNKDDDNEQEGNDQNRRGCNKHNTCNTTRKKKKSKKKKTEKKKISYKHKNIQKKNMLNSKCAKGRKKKNNRFAKSNEENNVDNKKEDADNAGTPHSGNITKKGKLTNENIISSKATSSVDESHMEKLPEACSSFKRYLEFVKNIDYDVKFGNAYIKLGKKLSSQNKCQFDVYEAEVVAVDNISSFFYCNIQNFENFYSLLKRNINNYDFLKTNINNHNYGENLEIDDSNVEDFLKNSQDSNLILNHFTNTINIANVDGKNSSTNSKNIPSRKRKFMSYINPPKLVTSKEITNDQSNPVQDEMPQNKHIDNMGSTHENVSTIKKCKDARNNVVDSIPNSSANTKGAPPSDMYTSRIVNININANANANSTASANKNADPSVRPEGSNLTNRVGAIIAGDQRPNTGLPHSTALRRGQNDTHSNVFNNRMINKTFSIMNKDRELLSNCRNRNNGNNSINGENCSKAVVGGKLPNLLRSNHMDNLRQNGQQNGQQNLPQNSPKRIPRNALCKSLIQAINRINFLKMFGYKSIYDQLKDQCKVFLVQKMTVEANTMYNIIKHVIRYNYINDAINNPFTIYQHSIKNMPSNKFAIKILNTSSCGIYKLKYKIHSLLSEGKQLKNVNIEIENYAQKKYQSEEYITKRHEQSVKNILQSKNSTQFDSLSTLNISSSDLSNSQYLESYKKMCSQKDTTTNNHPDLWRSTNKHPDSSRSSNENLDWYLSEILSIRNLMNNTLAPNNDMQACNYEQQPKYNYSMEVDKTNEDKNICASNGISSTTTNTKQNSISSNNLTSELSQIPIGDISTNSPNNAVYPFICKYCLNIFFEKDMALPNDANKNTLNKSLLNIYAEKNNEDNHVWETTTAKKKKLTGQHVDTCGHSCVSKSDPRVKENNYIVQVDSNGRSKEENGEIGRTKNATSNGGSEGGSRSVGSSRGTQCNRISRKNSPSIYLHTRNRIKRESIRRKRKQIANNKQKAGKNKHVRNKRVTKKETKLKTKHKIINKKRRVINAKKGRENTNAEVKNKLTDTENEKNTQQNNTPIKTKISKIPSRGCKLTSPIKREVPQSVVSCISSPSKNLRQNYDQQNLPLNIHAPDNSPNHNMNNTNKMKINVCKRCKEKNAPLQSSLAKEIFKKNKTNPGSVPKYLWTSVGITKNNEHVLGVAMQMIDGCTLTYIIQKLKGTENVKQGQFLLDICKKLVKHLMIICESVDNPIINWDTKPGNIMIKYETGISKIVCKKVTIIDVGDALPGRRFYFPTNPAYYEKIRINNFQKNFNNFLYYVICTKGFCSPECALLVFLLSSLNKSEQFRKTWYGANSNIFHITKTRQLRIKHRWKKLLDLRFIQPIVKKKDFMLSGQTFSPGNGKCPCNSEEDDVRSISSRNKDSTYCASVSDGSSYNRMNNNRNNAKSSTISNTKGNSSGSKRTIHMEKNGAVPHPVSVNVSLSHNHPNMRGVSGNGTIRNSNNGNSLSANPASSIPHSGATQNGNSYNSTNMIQKDRDNEINGNSGYKKSSSNLIKEKENSVSPRCKPVDLVPPNVNSEQANAESSEKRATSDIHHQNSAEEDILKGHYLMKICTHDMNDDGALEHYSDNAEIKEFLSKKDEKIKDMEIKLNESEKKKKKKKEIEYFKMQNIDSWVVKFTTKTTIFSVGLVLCQLFGGNNLLSVVNKDEVKVVDVLCEWNCKNSTNIYSGEKNITINDLLPSKGIFSDALWKRKIKKIINKCLQFVPSRRCSFKELYEDVKNFKREFEAYYNLNDGSKCDS
ncbi:hypothetical protein AK88_00924 [Plasmodium fragile]|uniref:Uncharacterized protein n=1 Tax=Plasmodium fragile TaxID=5857 RepID=A0A0D9QTY8_PLAFR|nr:uncharacterized protein AK88_00924 [Plasmodium fragile]KJP89481.1 hypothetical protein AK88_00924 [Plasmodium fragile]